MVTNIARFISFISNPIFVLLPVPFMLVYKTSGDFNYAMHWSIYSFIFILLIVAFVAYGVKIGKFTDFDVSKREQRPLLFSVTILLSVVYVSGLALLHGPVILLITILGILSGIFIATAVNTKIKASMHVATISSITTALSLAYGGRYWIILIVIPIVGWARVKIKRHTIPETIVGAILGSILSVSMYAMARAYL